MIAPLSRIHRYCDRLKREMVKPYKGTESFYVEVAHINPTDMSLAKASHVAKLCVNVMEKHNVLTRKGSK